MKRISCIVQATWHSTCCRLPADALQVTSIQEMGAYVHLLEYDNTEGMILLSELSRRRIRSINKLIKVLLQVQLQENTRSWLPATVC